MKRVYICQAVSLKANCIYMVKPKRLLLRTTHLTFPQHISQNHSDSINWSAFSLSQRMVGKTHQSLATPVSGTQSSSVAEWPIQRSEHTSYGRVDYTSGGILSRKTGFGSEGSSNGHKVTHSGTAYPIRPSPVGVSPIRRLHERARHNKNVPCGS